jgi:hypothetical protein
MPEHEPSTDTEIMHHREIILADGRYMVFYTFGEPAEGAAGQEEKRPVDAAPTGSAEENDV